MPGTADEICQQLDHVTATVFDSMMALRCEPLARAVESQWDIGARVLFLGVMQGCCTVLLGRDGAAALVRAMLAVDAEPGDALSSDAVCELCNMIAGGWKSGLKPDACSADMTPPCMYSPGAVDGPPIVTRSYLFAGFPLNVELRLHTPET